MGHHFHVHHSLLNGRVKQQCFHRFCMSHDDRAAPAWLLFNPFTAVMSFENDP